MAQITSTADVRIHEAIRLLAGRCDGAIADDGIGFAGPDTGLGHYLAGLADDQWTPAQLHEAWQLTRKYRRQLEGAGIDVDAIPEPPKPEVTDVREAAQLDRVGQRRGEIEVKNGEVVKRNQQRLELGDDEFILSFPYDAALVDASRSITGRRYHGQTKTNRYPLLAATAWGLKDFLDRHPTFEATADAAAKLDELTAAEGGEKPAWGTVELEDGQFLVNFPYERDVVGAIQKVPGRKWDAKRKINTVPRTAAAGEALSNFIADHRDRGWGISDEVQAEIDKMVELLAQQRADADKLRELSVAEDTEIDIEGLGGELRPFQRAGVKYALKTRRTFIADDMGTGKTVQALASALAADAFPLVVVCPQTMKLAWAKHVTGPTPGAPNGWLPGKTVRVLSGRTANPRLVQNADVIVINYDVLPAWVATLKAVRPKGLVMDESHYTKSRKAQRTKACRSIAKRIPADGLVLNLTGTANKNRPVEFVSQLEILGRLEEFGGYMNFVKRYCGAYQDRFGWNVSGASNLDELNQRLRSSCYIRRRKSDIMKELPPKQIATVPVELSNRREYDRVEADVIAWLRDQVVKDAEFLTEIADLPEEEQKRLKRDRQLEAQMRAERAEQLVRINKLRLVTGLGKIKAASEWAADFLDSDEEEKLVLFADHIEVQKGLLKALAKHNPVHVLGEDSSEAREAAVTAFQNDPTCRVIVCSIKAAGIGITLTAATNVAMVESSWTPADMDQAEDRLHRIGQEGQVTVWNFVADDSFDEDMAALLASKRAVVTAATDGREDVSRVSILPEMLDRLMKKGR